MAAYIRVELHENSPFDKPGASAYEELHRMLSTKGIVRTVDITNGGNQILPSGLYYTKASDKNAIGQDIDSATRNLGYPFSYVVVISAGALVHNLKLYSR